MKTLLLHIVILLLSFSPSAAQEPYAIHLNQTSGLPSNSVYTAFQDRKGYIWFASDAGLTKYDGYEFRTYKINEQTSTAGSCIQEDKYGRIWYENFDGYLYYVQNDSLHALSQKNVLNYLPFGIANDYIFIMQKQGVDVYDLRSLKLLKTILFEFPCVEFSTSVNDDFYFIANNELFQIDKNLNIKTTKFFTNTKECVKSIYKNNDDFYVLSKYNENKQLYLFDRKLNYKQKIKINEPELIQGSSFIDHQFWIYTSKGVYAYDSMGRAELYFRDKSISSVFKDIQNNYWITTTNEGVYIVPSLQNKIRVISDFLPNKIIKGENGFLIGGKRGGLMSLDYKLTNSTNLVSMPEKSELYYLYFDSTNKNVLFSSKGLSIVPNSDFQKIKYFPISLKELVKLDDKYYGFVASSFCGILLSPTAKKGTTSIWDSFYQSQPIDKVNNVVHFASNIRGKALVFDHKRKVIYYSGNIGFFKKTINGNIEIKKDGKSFFASKIFLSDNTIYALSTMGILYKITNEQDFQNINSLLELPEFEIRMARQFGDYLYLVTSHNVLSLNLKTNRVIAINLSINPAEINDLFVDEHSIYVLNNEGLVLLPLNSPSQSARNLRFYVNAISSGNAQFTPNASLVFNHTQTEINFHFSLLDFGNTATTSIYYKLNNDNWKRIPPEIRTLSFLSLAYGSYSLSFKVNDTIQKDTYSFQIMGPFWQEWWFIGLVLLLVLLAAYYYYRSRIALLSRQIVLLQEKVALEQSLGKSILTSIKSQMNPHFFYNALNTIQAYIFSNDKRNASLYLGKFSKLTRMILEMSEKELIALNEEIQALTLYLELEKMRFDDDFNFEFSVEKGLDVDLIKIPSMLIQPYVENAIKHGLLHRKGDKRLVVTISKEEDYLNVLIDDNGIGRVKSEEMKKIKKENHQSFSTRANEKRLEILNRNKTKKVLVEMVDKLSNSNYPLGTQVILMIPIA